MFSTVTVVLSRYYRVLERRTHGILSFTYMTFSLEIKMSNFEYKFLSIF